VGWWVGMRKFPTVLEARRWSGLVLIEKGSAFLSINLKIFDHQTDAEPYDFTSICKFLIVKIIAFFFAELGMT
jgi:hypothetical protein